MGIKDTSSVNVRPRRSVSVREGLAFIKELIMAENRGKQFEGIIEESFKSIPNTMVVRLHDQTTGFKGSKNPCDFLIYHRPLMYAIECKSVHGNTLPFSNITDFQWSELLKMSTVENLVAGIICWWIDKDVTLFIPIKTLNIWRTQTSVKSVRFDIYQKDFDVVVIHGTKKRVFFGYDIEKFFSQMEEKYAKN